MFNKTLAISLILFTHFAYPSEKQAGSSELEPLGSNASLTPESGREENLASKVFHTDLYGQFIHIQGLVPHTPSYYKDAEDRYGRVSGDEIFKLHFSIEGGATGELLTKLKALMLRHPELTRSAKIYKPSWRKLIETQISLAEAWGMMSSDFKRYTEEDVEKLVASLYEQSEKILKKESPRIRDKESLDRILRTKDNRESLVELIDDLSPRYLPSSKRLAGGYAEGTFYLKEGVTSEQMLAFSTELEKILGPSPIPPSLGLSALPLPGFTRVSIRKAYLQSGSYHNKIFTYCSTSTSSEKTLQKLEIQLFNSPLYKKIAQKLYKDSLAEKESVLEEAQEALQEDEANKKTLARLLKKVQSLESSFDFLLKRSFFPIQKKKKKKNKAKERQKFKTLMKKHLSELNTAELMMSAEIKK